MKTIQQLLSGKKTYIIGILTILILLVQHNWDNPTVFTPDEITGFSTVLGLMGLRAGVTKSAFENNLPPTK